jgi:ubiquinone/menaquinone biosynthesis C-methylase UbiE
MTMVSNGHHQDDPIDSMEFINLAWLLDHHEAKIEYRRRMVADVAIAAGETVLDLGCGPGLWSELLATHVGPTGRVIGVDLSTALIDFACERQRASEHGDVMEFQVGDFYDLSFPDDSFSTAFFGNCLAYCTDPVRVLDEQRRVTRPGGRIVVKDFDGGLIVFHPVDQELSCRVLEATARRLREDPLDPPFDNYTGRKLVPLMRDAGLSDVTATSYAIGLTPPLSDAAKRYIAGNARWYGDTGRRFLTDDDYRSWTACFDEKSDRYVLDRDDVYFCMLEVMCIGTV